MRVRAPVCRAGHAAWMRVLHVLRGGAPVHPQPSRSSDHAMYTRRVLEAVEAASTCLELGTPLPLPALEAVGLGTLAGLAGRS